MHEAIKKLVDNGLINEDAKTEIQEAWNAKVKENREQVTAELREEFARRYEHDKSSMVEALDRMVTEALTDELTQIAEEKKKIAAERVEAKKKMKESSEKFQKFMLSTLSEEIKELRADRTQQSKVVEGLEKFVVSQLSEEISEFQADRRDVAATKVRLVKEARENFTKLKKDFVSKSSEILEAKVSEHLKGELTQLREDIEAAKKNNFGRKIFEAFAAEFSASHLNENQEIRALSKELKNYKAKLDEAKVAVAKSKKLVESKNKEVQSINESVRRKETMNNLLRPLNKEKAAIMADLLESVQTDKLKNAFDRYLPTVLDGKKIAETKEKAEQKRQPLNESRREVTGNKKTKTPPENNGPDELSAYRKLAGLK